MPLDRPSDTVGAARGSLCLDQAYIEPQQNVTNRDSVFFMEKLEKLASCCVIFLAFAVNRDMKNHDKLRNLMNRVFFIR